MDTRRVRIAVFIPLTIAVLFAAGFLAMGHHLPALARDGVPTQATVTAKEPQNHSSIVYQYSVGGAAYSGSASVPDLEAVRIGDSVPVTYLRSHPSVSVTGDAQAVYSSWLRTLIMVTLSVAIIPAALGLFAEFTRSHLTKR